MESIPSSEIVHRVEGLHPVRGQRPHYLFHGDLRPGLDLLGHADGIAHLICADRCDRLAERLPQRMNDALKVLPELRQAAYWQLSQPAVADLLSEFFGQVPHSPGFLIAHGLSWADAIVRRTYYGDRLTTEKTSSSWMPDGPFVLQFDHAGSRPLACNGRRIPWLAPVGLYPEIDGLVKVSQTRRTLTSTGRVTSTSYREQVGVASPAEADEALVLGGLMPGIRHRLYNPDQRPSAQSPALIRWNASDVEAHKVFPGQAIFDLGLLQAHRVRAINPAGAMKLLALDELTVAIDRPTGLVAYLVAHAGPLGDGAGNMPAVALQSLWQKGLTDT